MRNPKSYFKFVVSKFINENRIKASNVSFRVYEEDEFLTHKFFMIGAYVKGSRKGFFARLWIEPSGEDKSGTFHIETTLYTTLPKDDIRQILKDEYKLEV